MSKGVSLDDKSDARSRCRKEADAEATRHKSVMLDISGNGRLQRPMGMENTKLALLG
jgi:hypothetical protein